MRFAQIFEGESEERMFEAENTAITHNPESGVCITYFYCFLGFIYIVYTIIDVPISPFSFAYLHPALNTPHRPHHHTVVCVLCTHVLWLIPSPSFIQSPSPALWQLSVCSMYPRLCFYFVHQFILLTLHFEEQQECQASEGESEYELRGKIIRVEETG